MIMGFKYQIVQCTSPFQILQISLQHLEILKSLVKSEVIEKAVQSAINLTLNMYGSLSNSQWFILQQSLLKFLQGKKTKVSLFLQRNLQLTDGTLVLDNAGALPFGVEKPGTIRHFEGGEVVSETTVDIDGYGSCMEATEMFESDSHLGFNMFIPQEQNNTLSAGTFPSISIASKDLGTRLMCKNAQSSGGRSAEGKSMLKSSRADMKSSAKQVLLLSVHVVCILVLNMSFLLMCICV